MCACITCGKPTKQFKCGKHAKYCGPKCRSGYRKKIHDPRPCLHCGVLFVPNIGLQRFCCKRHSEQYRYLHPTRKPLQCKGCGTQFVPKGSDRKGYCSRECAYRNIKQWCKPPARAGLRKRPNPWMQFKRWAKCELCDKPTYSKWHRGDITCKDPACIAERIRVRSTPGAIPWSCTKCGTAMPRARGRYEARRCDTCRVASKRAGRRKRRELYGPNIHRSRARRNGVPWEPVNRLIVFKRDGWVCQICKRQVLRKWTYANAVKRVPHPRSPTLDHITPMSKGGPHTYDNVQCACFECNWMSSDGAKVSA